MFEKLSEFTWKICRSWLENKRAGMVGEGQAGGGERAEGGREAERESQMEGGRGGMGEREGESEREGEDKNVNQCLNERLVPGKLTR